MFQPISYQNSYEKILFQHSKVPSSKPSTSIEKLPVKEDAAPKMPIRDISTLFDRQRESMDTTGK